MRQDIHILIAFLATRVRAYDKDYWLNIKIPLNYIRVGVYLTLILQVKYLFFEVVCGRVLHNLRQFPTTHGRNDDSWTRGGATYIPEAEDQHLYINQ